MESGAQKAKDVQSRAESQVRCRGGGQSDEGAWTTWHDEKQKTDPRPSVGPK